MGKNNFTSKELRFLIAMGMVLGLRELSMTMLNPFISIYGRTLIGNTPFLCGIGFGIYGLTNAVFQIPYGILSDKYGRKPVILIGLLQLAIGMVVAYLSENIYLFIFARALQGSGAVMAIAYAWLGDNVKDSRKGRAMSIAGTIVGIGAVIAFGIGPLLYRIMSVADMFLLCAVFILIAFSFILVVLKEEIRIEESLEFESDNTGVKNQLLDKGLIKLSICAFINSLIMQTTFFMVPTYLDRMIGAKNFYAVFLPAIIIGIVIMSRASISVDEGKFKKVAMTCFLFLAIASVLLAFKSIITVIAGVFVVLSCFMCLTSGIPSVINKMTDKSRRGRANGVLQTLTFLGFFMGPVMAGILVQNHVKWFLYPMLFLAAVLGDTLVYTV